MRPFQHPTDRFRLTRKLRLKRAGDGYPQGAVVELVELPAPPQRKDEPRQRCIVCTALKQRISDQIPLDAVFGGLEATSPLITIIDDP